MVVEPAPGVVFTHVALDAVVDVRKELSLEAGHGLQGAGWGQRGHSGHAKEVVQEQWAKRAAGN
jgi:hypothetical protein